MAWAWRQIGSTLWELETDDGFLKSWDQGVPNLTDRVQCYQFKMGTTEADCLRTAMKALNGILIPAGGVLLVPGVTNTANRGQYPFTFLISSYDRDVNTNDNYAICSILVGQKDAAIFNAGSTNKRWRLYFNRIEDRFRTTTPQQLNNLSPSNPADWDA